MRFFCASAALAGAATVSFGAISSVTGSALLISPPPSTALGALQSNTRAPAFDERQDLVLGAGLSVDITTPGIYDALSDLTPGVIAAGTRVHSHYLYADPERRESTVYEGSVLFDQQVLGIIVLRSALNASDAALGAPGTIYADNEARGLEFGQDRVTLVLSGNRVNFRFTTSTATDDIRVITAVPAPAGVLALAPALLATLRRRRAK
ncbi:MAG: hypothetical protein SFZ23_04810 [Planctomycetota bacterium]|nr:hypothetical protein [Planctomycetota bacterium]